jgi:Flp pilus assembly protein protease CpaA
MWSVAKNIVTILVLSAIFLALSYTTYGRVVNTVVFVFLLVFVVVALHYIEKSQKLR